MEMEQGSPSGSRPPAVGHREVDGGGRPRRPTFFDRLPDWVRIASALFYCAMLCIVVIGAPIVADYWYREDVYANAMAAFFGIAVALVLVVALAIALATSRRGAQRRAGPRHAAVRGRPFPFGAKLLIALVLLAVVQGVIVRYCLFVTDWDVGNVTLRYGEEALGTYLSIYPFQAFLVGIFRLAAAPVGLMGSNEAYAAAVVLGVVAVDVSVALATVTARRLFGEVWGWLVFGLAAWFCGVSPWILIPYTDTYTMPFPIAIVTCYACWLPRSRVRPVVWGVIALLAVFGYALKPTAVFAFAAVVAVALCRCVARRGRPATEAGAPAVPGPLRRPPVGGVLTCCACAVGAALAFGTVGVVSRIGAADVAIAEGRSFGLPHYLMMGSSYGGGYTREDVELSTSIASPAERTRTNLEVWGERLSEMGLGGTQALAVRKALTTFASGAFTWGQEGEFYVEFPYENMNLLHRFYGIPTREQVAAGNLDDLTAYEGAPASSAPYFTLSQVLWLAMLLCVCLGLVDRDPSDPLRATYAALFALGVFLLIFECRARYLILYLPLFCLAAVSGLRALAALIARARGRTAEGSEG